MSMPYNTNITLNKEKKTFTVPKGIVHEDKESTYPLVETDKGIYTFGLLYKNEAYAVVYDTNKDSFSVSFTCYVRTSKDLF